ncbi:MAG: cytosine permease [Vicinamibacteria bacterium]|jgi:NCS1 nucleoside transporter family|nr:cytosine permease [Vicinamibacteria bacterium]
MNAVDLEPIPAAEKTQSALDLFLIFAGANVVATTFITGATLKAGLPFSSALAAAALGSLIGAGLVALLVPVGSKWGVPSIIALRAPLGRPGAHLVAVILYITNFAWIALNNVIAASVTEVIFPSVDMRVLAVALGIAATMIVAGGPRLVALANRAAVPLMVVAGSYLAFLAMKSFGSVSEVSALPALSMWQALDLVIAYQVSWILMFADYSRYSASPRRSGLAVFASLALTSILGMSLGALLSAISGSADPGGMLAALGSPLFGALLLAVATITTNFVNIYLSALALRSLIPRIPDGPAVLVTGFVGAALSVLSREWIDGYSAFMGALGLILVPLGGVALAQFFPFPRNIDPLDLYKPGRFMKPGWAGLVAWAAGAFVYWKYQATGATVPALLVSFALYATWRRTLAARESETS